MQVRTENKRKKAQTNFKPGSSVIICVYWKIYELTPGDKEKVEIVGARIHSKKIQNKKTPPKGIRKYYFPIRLLNSQQQGIFKVQITITIGQIQKSKWVSFFIGEY